MARVVQFGGSQVSYVDLSQSLSDSVIVKGEQTQKFLARVCSPRESPPLELVYYRSVGGRVVDEIWRMRE